MLFIIFSQFSAYGMHEPNSIKNVGCLSYICGFKIFNLFRGTNKDPLLDQTEDSIYQHQKPQNNPNENTTNQSSAEKIFDDSLLSNKDLTKLDDNSNRYNLLHDQIIYKEIWKNQQSSEANSN